ncbi:2OG-Fe dioxygenase [Tenacibaculum sp. MAR_2009_124]|uniref:2OG-Fe dioxygenase family protein n=1 Tax=Tenacibaculum sp. MAR_2009_124 TaxID=1250059 RepID=UPI00089B3046|nr:2OG-Fe dioxygenase family protein [Tenacibaculum sp. MAR_2009_124]SEC32351.1 2OG-Fe dioxygenase [Tenacibaculum sp. MAR_2009_124]
MITEKQISQQLKREIKSPIRIGNLVDLNIDTKAFLKCFQPFFENLEDDCYLVRENQIKYLKTAFPEDVVAINEIRKAYFYGKVTAEILEPWIRQLGREQKTQFENSSMVTRQRSIASFTIEKKDNEFVIERISESSFEQNVDDFRSWQRVFKEADEKVLKRSIFNQLLQEAFKMVAVIHPSIQKLKITSHFMRTIAAGIVKGENSPEGVHEDGANYIISALVVNRRNITGGETQIFEKRNDENELIFQKELEVGEFAFQADTGEEKTFGNDLWHYVTPIQSINKTEIGVRDIIGFDIQLLDSL